MSKDSRFSRESWLVLACALALCLANAAQVLYRFAVPTDGWLALWSEAAGRDGEPRLVFRANLLDEPSPLQPGDQLLALEGVAPGDFSFTVGTFPNAADLRAQWQSGQPIQYTVRRGDDVLSLEVRPRTWTPAAWWRGLLVPGAAGVDMLDALILAGVGLLVFWKRPGNASARALFFFCAVNLSSVLSNGTPYGVQFGIDPLMAYVGSFFNYASYVALLAPSLLVFTLVFPRPKAFLQRQPGWLYAPYGLGFVVTGLILSGVIGLVGWVISMLMFLAALASLAHSLVTARDAVSRAQMRWAVGGIGLGLGFTLLTFVPVFALPPGPLADVLGLGGVVGFNIIGLSLGVAVLRYRLWDIDLIIRRTLIYTSLTLVLGLVYFGGVAVLQGLFTAVGGGQSPAAIVISTLAIAALFSPTRRRVQAFIDRRFYRRKYDAGRTLADFAAAARDETDLARLSTRLMGVVDETLQPERAWLWLRPEGDRVGQ
jgi:hypothetical protein